MQEIGTASARRMFGGYGIFLDGLMFALIADGTLYLKTDADNEATFRDRDLKPFVYYKRGRPCAMSYFRAPEETLESRDEMTRWARLAFNAALRAGARKRRRNE
ncbi:MAG: transcriptional regulator [Proteobacteria bacterium]|nr:MAG: transcriptional regulator [Pseudomonadota bacterium]